MLPMQTDRMIPGYYFVLLMESCINKHLNCVHNWAKVMLKAEIRLKYGQLKETK